MSTDMLGVEAGDPLLLSFYGTAAAYNKSLRKELINMRDKRDRFLQARIKILKPFLVDKVRSSFDLLFSSCVCLIIINTCSLVQSAAWRFSSLTLLANMLLSALELLLPQGPRRDRAPQGEGDEAPGGQADCREATGRASCLQHLRHHLQPPPP